ncbi:MAG: hypothetical protein ACE5HQ_02705 [Gemmatimonadota bacterium]
MILPNVRASFGRQEAQWLVRVLSGRVEREERRWEERLAEHGIDSLLDHPGTLDAMLRQRGIMAVPPRLFFYVALRSTLLERGVRGRGLADYLTALVLHFGQARRPYRIADYDDQEYFYLVDVLAELERARGRRAFLLRAHLGNFALWLSGLFPDYIAARVRRKGAPGIDYYEAIGQSGYRMAAEDPYARRRALDSLYLDAAGAFGPLRLALNRFSDRWLFPRANSPESRLLRQVHDEMLDRWRRD